MTCRELNDFLLQYLSAELTPEVRTTFEAHLRDCPPCAAYLKSYEDTVALTRAVLADPDAAVPEDVPEELVQAVLAARRQRPH